MTINDFKAEAVLRFATALVKEYGEEGRDLELQETQYAIATIAVDTADALCDVITKSGEPAIFQEKQ